MSQLRQRREKNCDGVGFPTYSDGHLLFCTSNTKMVPGLPLRWSFAEWHINEVLFLKTLIDFTMYLAW